MHVHKLPACIHLLQKHNTCTDRRSASRTTWDTLVGRKYEIQDSNLSKCTYFNEQSFRALKEDSQAPGLSCVEMNDRCFVGSHDRLLAMWLALGPLSKAASSGIGMGPFTAVDMLADVANLPPVMPATHLFLASGFNNFHCLACVSKGHSQLEIELSQVVLGSQRAHALLDPVAHEIYDSNTSRYAPSYSPPRKTNPPSLGLCWAWKKWLQSWMTDTLD